MLLKGAPAALASQCLIRLLWTASLLLRPPIKRDAGRSSHVRPVMSALVDLAKRSAVYTPLISTDVLPIEQSLGTLVAKKIPQVTDWMQIVKQDIS